MRGSQGVLVLIALVAVVLVVAVVLWSRPAASPTPAPAAGSPREGLPAASPPPGSSSLTALLAGLPTAVEERAGYERSLFEHWIDADGDGCDTRREVLIEESLQPVAISGACDLTGGRWRSPYDGVETGDPSTFDVDHVVPLAEAWDSGASRWPPERRRRFANDLDVGWALVAVSAESNRSKGDRDPADWRPPLPGVQCTYAGMWIAVKVRWQLAIDLAERGALAAVVSGCGETLVVPIAP